MVFIASVVSEPLGTFNKVLLLLFPTTGVTSFFTFFMASLVCSVLPSFPTFFLTLSFSLPDVLCGFTLPFFLTYILTDFPSFYHTYLQYLPTSFRLYFLTLWLSSSILPDLHPSFMSTSLLTDFPDFFIVLSVVAKCISILSCL